jgi:hypothetical protein
LRAAAALRYGERLLKSGSNFGALKPSAVERIAAQKGGAGAESPHHICTHFEEHEPSA